MMALAKHEREIPLPIELTRMRRRHLGKVLSIEARVYPRPWSLSLFLSELAHRHSRKYIVARHGGEVVGYGGMMFVGQDAHITNVAVDPDFHGRQIGTRLMLAMVTEAMARACTVVSLEVRVSNSVARAMYEKFGFAVTGVRKGYYVETNEDAYVMEARDLLSTDYRLRIQAIREGLRRHEGAS